LKSQYQKLRYVQHKYYRQPTHEILLIPYQPQGHLQHIIGYTCNIDNFGGKWAVWITETFKTINDLPILHLDTSKFNNSVIYRRKTSCFHVKYDICTIIQRNILCSITNWYTIIYYVCLYTIKYFHPI